MEGPKADESKEHSTHNTHNAEKKSGKFRMRWKLVSLVLLAVLAASVFTNGFSFGKTEGKALSADQAGKAAVDFVNSNYLGEGQQATLVAVEEGKYNMYKVSFEIEGQKFTSYITKDAGMFFPTAAEVNITPAETTPASQFPQSDKPEVRLFVMSYCPYGNQAEDGMKPVAELLGDKMDYHHQYIFYSDYATMMRSRGYNVSNKDYCLDEDETYCSMHGIQELNQGIRELCVYDSQKDKFWAFVDAMNKKCTSANADSCWEQVAKDLGIDTAAVNSCQSAEAFKLVEEQVKVSAEFSASGSPTLMINGKAYSGVRTPDAYKTAICSAFKNPPAECSQSLSTTGAAASGQC